MFAYARAYGKLKVRETWTKPNPMSDQPIQTPPLHTQRLRLVPLAEGHAQALHTLSVDREVRRYLYAGRIIPMAQVHDIIATSQDCFARHATGFYGMIIDETSHAHHGQFAGFCGHRQFEGGEDMELVFGLDPQVWGFGLGAEAAREVLRHGFEDCDIPRVIAATDTPNQRSVRVLQKLGMSFRERREWHGLDTMFYEITADEFMVHT